MVLVIPKKIQEKLGVDETQELLNFIVEEQEKAKVELRKEYLGEDEKSELRIEKKITEETTKLDKRITEETAKLDKRIEEVKSEMIKWMFIFWISQTVIIIGSVAGLLKIMLK